MKKIIVVVLTLGFVFSCTKQEEKSQITISDDAYLIFGNFYGECFGENCVQTYKLTNTSLFKDTIRDYSAKKMYFIELDNEKFKQVSNLISVFPKQLLKENKTVIGCPDCADQGGLLIQYFEKGNLQSWRIDQNKSNVPSYLHGFMGEVNKKINLINK